MSKYQNYGNVKMKGKKEKLLPCGCCVAINKKYQESIIRYSDAMAREIDREVLETLKRHDWSAAVKKINGPSGRS
jgi:hypothetical protein